MQDLQRPVTRRQHWHREPPQDVRVAFHERCVPHPERTRGTDDRGGAEGGMHTSILSWLTHSPS